MSEYQYYEFQAIDRPLSERELRELRAISTRATITPTRFTNFYTFGDFKGDPSAMVEKYFDVFLYLANWGTHRLMLRFPKKVLDLKTAQLYCLGNTVSARTKGDFVILDFHSEDEEGDWEDDGGDRLSSLVPLRSNIASGDYRALYLAWLLCAQAGELDDDEAEPPCPPGLGKLTAPLEAFVEFMRIDRDLLEEAAARSPDGATTASRAEIEGWVTALPESEKAGLLVRLIEGGEPHLRAELLRRLEESRGTASRRSAERPRTAGELLNAAEQRAEERRRKEAERAARERARREREAVEARERYLANLAKREAEAWGKVDALIDARQPGKYDEAVKLLGDLRDLGVRKGRAAEVEARVRRLCEEHARKPSFVERLKKAGLAEAKP